MPMGRCMALCVAFGLAERKIGHRNGGTKSSMVTILEAGEFVDGLENVSMSISAWTSVLNSHPTSLTQQGHLLAKNLSNLSSSRVGVLQARPNMLMSSFIAYGQGPLPDWMFDSQKQFIDPTLLSLTILICGLPPLGLLLYCACCRGAALSKWSAAQSSEEREPESATMAAAVEVLSAARDLAREMKRRDSLPDGLPLDFWDDHPELSGKEISEQNSVPISPEEAAKRCPAGGGGIIWHAKLVTDGSTIKPCRPLPEIAADEFFRSLVKLDDGRVIFSGRLNGWKGLSCLELRSITTLVRRLKTKIERLWDADEQKVCDLSSQLLKGHSSVRVTLREAPHTAHGWSANCPGFVFWHFGQSTKPFMATGEGMIPALHKEIEKDMPQAVNIHVFGHRFAKKEGEKESTEDWMTYHVNTLVEWDHGRFCTVIELGNLHAAGASRGKSVWFPPGDRTLAIALPDDMQKPWLPLLAEMRCTDVSARNLEEFKAYTEEHSGPGKYFMDLRFQYSGKVRLHHRSQEDVMRYLLNYMGRDRRYSKVARNCQFFAADFFSFMAGKSGILPFSKIMVSAYRNRSHLFLYDPSMFGVPVFDASSDMHDEDSENVST